MSGSRTGTSLVVGIVGAGTMGAGIAQVCLAAGHQVRLHDADPDAPLRARARIADGFARSLAKGRITAGERDVAMARLSEAGDLDAMAADARHRNRGGRGGPAAQADDLRHLDMYSRPDVPLATNTSALSVADMAAAAHHRERVVGLHFFNPAPLMPLVEVVVTSETDRDIADACLEFVAGLGKTPVLSRDSPGFIVNRVNRPFTLEALRVLETGAGTVEGIDAAVEGAGYPMGPFRLMDLVGIDVNLAVARALFEGFRQPGRFRPSPIQVAMVEAGRLGRKSGDGFYRYEGEAAVAPGAAPPAGSGSGLPALSPEQVVERIELATVNEAYRAVEEAVASPPDIDLAMKLGANHPMGPFERAGQLGLRALVEGLHRLHEEASADGTAGIRRPVRGGPAAVADRHRLGGREERGWAARFDHLFMHVTSLATTRRFYVDLIGLEVLADEGAYIRLGSRGGLHREASPSAWRNASPMPSGLGASSWTSRSTTWTRSTLG